jgi:predicted dehydrogenase
VDSMRWWFGEISEVAGASAVSMPTIRAGGGNVLHADAEDTFALLLRFASGAIGNIACSTAAWHGPGEEIRAFGSHGMLTVASDGTLWGARSGDPSPQPLPIPARLIGSGIPEVDDAGAGHPLIPPFIRLARAWAQGIRTGTNPSPSFADGLRAQ